MQQTAPQIDLTIKQVAEQLQVTERTIHSWISSGQLTAHRLGVRCVRIRQADVNKLMQRIPAPDRA